MKYKIFTDGGSRGNPGPGAIGFVIFDVDGNELFKIGKQIGLTTNNMAEYSAVEEALMVIKNNYNQNKENIFEFNIDSLLVVNQLNGLFKIKNLNLKEKIIKIKQMEKEIFGKISYQYIPREKNFLADSLVNSSF